MSDTRGSSGQAKEGSLQDLPVVIVVFLREQAGSRNNIEWQVQSGLSVADEPSVPKFQKEGQALREWPSLVWHKCYQILDEVSAGTRDVPSDAGLIAELPQLNYPAA